MQDLDVTEGDLVYIADARWWLGGIRSIQLKAGPAAGDGAVQLSAESIGRGSLELKRPVKVEKIF
jgi:hypothetical protein